MQHDQFNDKTKPADSAGTAHSSLKGDFLQKIEKAFLEVIFLFGHSTAAVMRSLCGNDSESSSAVLDWLREKKLIKSVATDQQQSGELIKLTRVGVNYATTNIEVTRETKYDSSSRIQRNGFVPHDIAAQLYLCMKFMRDGFNAYLPEGSMAISRKTKYFDVVVKPEPGLLVGLEIEKTPKYSYEMVATIGRAIRATRERDVDYVVFVLPNETAKERYDSVLDEDCIAVSRKVGRRWVPDYVIDLSSEDLMRIVCVVCGPEVWKGAM